MMLLAAVLFGGLVMSILPFFVVAFRLCQPLPDKVKFLFRSGYALLRFLLESMKDVNGALKTHGVHGTPCIAAVVGHDLKHAPASKSLERLRRRIDLTLLRGIEGRTDFGPDWRRKGSHVLE